MGIDGGEIKRQNKPDILHQSFRLSSSTSDKKISLKGILFSVLKALGGVVIFFFVLMVIVLNSDNPNQFKTTSEDKFEVKHITAHEYGKTWPLTIDSGILNCVNNTIQGYEKSYVTITFNNTTWALNGSAQNIKAYRPRNEIWKANPEDPGSGMPDPGIISRGLKLCR